jgi:pimeloyl-ACP methyl ester carboxylesterase
MSERGADRTLRLEDGRTLGFRIWGDPEGAPVLFLHGTPGSRLKFAIAHDAGRDLGLALIAPDRWGYGLSSVPADPSLQAFAGDMAALMDGLGHRRFAVGGISGGGPFAAAVAASMPQRVTALALVSPMGPVADLGVARLSGFHRFCFTRLPALPMATACIFGAFRLSLRHAPRLAGQLATLRGGRPDKDVIVRPEICEHLLGSFREGLRPGMRGPITDLALFSRPWGVDLSSIRAPARVWVGTRDKAVPLAAASELARRIDGCVYEELEGEGHLWVAANYRRVLEWLGLAMHARCQLPSACHG